MPPPTTPAPHEDQFRVMQIQNSTIEEAAVKGIIPKAAAVACLPDELAHDLRVTKTAHSSGTYTNCAGWFVRGECENGHEWAKEIVCGREWCVRCGKVGSEAHQRRYSRLVAKGQHMATMGYFVFTIPDAQREHYRTKAQLDLLMKKLVNGDKSQHITGVLRSLGFSRGVMRWHWFGDKSNTWAPHLNVLVEAGHIAPEVLAQVKAEWARILGVDMAVVHYQWTKRPAVMMHRMRYITRATFLDIEWDRPMAVELYNFRNARYWGKWDDEVKWECTGDPSVGVVGSLEQHECPCCGGHVAWVEAMPIEWLQLRARYGRARPVGGGYWDLSGVAPARNKGAPGPLWDEDELEDADADVSVVEVEKE